MPGIRLRQVFAPNGTQLYTLYSSRSPGYAPGYETSGTYGYASEDTWSDGDIVTFVHVLNLRNGWAYCVGMPKAFWDQPASAQAIASSPDGRSLFVVDSVRGIVAEMDTKSLQVLRTTRVDFGEGVGDRTSAQVSADGSTLFVGTAGGRGASVTAIATASLMPTDGWAVPGTVSGLGLSADGRNLYVASGNRLLVVDPADGHELTTVAFDGIGSILRIGTPGV
jgi:sugar lactone lactonase YvrE